MASPFDRPYRPYDMTIPQALAIPAVGNPGQFRHFWDYNNGCVGRIKKLFNLGPKCKHEEPMWPVWEKICRTYFSEDATSTNDFLWTITREAYRGVPPASLTTIRPDILVIGLTPLNYVLGSGPGVQYERDCLWIECKAAFHSTPSGWSAAINELTVRLHEAHHDRSLYAAVCIGMHFLLFTWDPHNRIQHTQLKIRSHNQQEIWELDARLKCVNTRIDRWFDATTGEIDLRQARSIECWEVEDVHGQQLLKNREDLTVLEQFLLTIQAMPLQGINPDYWH